jgi:16S rRNA (guanine(966)-N(2))-methyltransferase RsmD
MRIIAGSSKGRTLIGPKSDDVIRPTSDRVRQTLFNVLGQWCEGFEVLDVFAGTGALALEALSRGASRAVLIDSGREAQGLCRANAEALGYAARVELLAMPAVKGLEVLGARGVRFDLIFADAPYKLQAGELVLAAVEAKALLKAGGRVVVEHASVEQLTSRVGALQSVDERAFGDTVVTIFELTR